MNHLLSDRRSNIPLPASKPWAIPAPPPARLRGDRGWRTVSSSCHPRPGWLHRTKLPPFGHRPSVRFPATAHFAPESAGRSAARPWPTPGSGETLNRCLSVLDAESSRAPFAWPDRQPVHRHSPEQAPPEKLPQPPFRRSAWRLARFRQGSAVESTSRPPAQLRFRSFLV